MLFNSVIVVQYTKNIFHHSLFLNYPILSFLKNSKRESPNGEIVKLQIVDWRHDVQQNDALLNNSAE